MRPAAALAPLAVLVAAVTGVGLYALSRPAPPPSRKVKLAVLVVFDQMRGDYLQKWKPLFGPSGFARLQRDGAWFTNCHYPYGTTTTGPGHASMLTGACGDSHGIINNYWLEGAKVTYCAASDRYKLVPTTPKFPPDEKDKKATQPADPKEAGTPDRLLSETVLHDRRALVVPTIVGERGRGGRQHADADAGDRGKSEDAVHDRGDS